ncbi:unnamed protein product [Meganyctiphanes norvegica]|uniref:Uncharacterized protein n=1 Tax=Meganyctiphanes norvegica TaxID=48144 RepID=A0AAV2R6F9_MEGNR
MKILTLISAAAAVAVAAPNNRGYVSMRNQIFGPNSNKFPSGTTATDVAGERSSERKIHQFDAEPNNTFARHPERQVIGVLNTDFVPSDEYTDFLLAYLPDITEILKEVKIANGGEMPPLGNNPAHWLKMLLPLGRRYLQTRASLEGRDHLWAGEEKALHFVDRVTGSMMQFVQELSDV